MTSRQLFLLSGDKPRNSSLTLRVADELRKPLELCFFPLCADDPKGCHPLVPRSLGAEEFPSAFVGVKLSLQFTSELRMLPLFIGISGGLFCVASSEDFEAGGMHQTLFCESSDEVDVDFYGHCREMLLNLKILKVFSPRNEGNDNH